MTLLVHFLQYRLHLSEITNDDTRNNDNDRYRLPVQLSVHHYSSHLVILKLTKCHVSLTHSSILGDSQHTLYLEGVSFGCNV